MRNKFLEYNFKIVKFNGLILMVLKDQCIDHIPQCTTTALANAYEAIDQKYVGIILILST